MFWKNVVSCLLIIEIMYFLKDGGHNCHLLICHIVYNICYVSYWPLHVYHTIVINGHCRDDAIWIKRVARHTTSIDELYIHHGNSNNLSAEKKVYRLICNYQISFDLMKANEGYTVLSVLHLLFIHILRSGHYTHARTALENQLRIGHSGWTY